VASCWLCHHKIENENSLTNNCIRFGSFLIKEEKGKDYPLASFFFCFAIKVWKLLGIYLAKCNTPHFWINLNPIRMWNEIQRFLYRRLKMSHQFYVLSCLYLKPSWFGAYFYFVIHGRLRVRLLALRSDTLSFTCFHAFYSRKCWITTLNYAICNKARRAN